MARTKTILQSNLPYNISGRCMNRDWFEVPLEGVWEILCEELSMAVILHELKVHSFVLMSNHFHLTVSTPQANIDQVMKRFMEMTSKRLGEQSKRVNRIWGARYYKTVLDSYPYYLNAYKYNYFNPVKAGEVDRCEDYRFSTLHGLLGRSRLYVPLESDELLFGDVDETLQWLNQHPTAEQLKAVQSAMKKSRFQHVKAPGSRKQIIADDEVI